MAQLGQRLTGHTVVPNSPAVKRQKTAGGYQSTSNSTGYNSEADSGDELFEGVIETPPAKHFTQPTQIIDRSANPSSPASEPSPVVQIPASSPFRQEAQALTSKPTQPMPNGGRLASLMAPAGTAYRPPIQRPVAKPLPQSKPAIIDLSDDDGPQYKGGSSDDDGPSRAEIKPSSFSTKSSKSSFGGIASPEGLTSSEKFKDLMATSMFKGAQNRPAFDLKGSVYDSRSRDPIVTSSKIISPVSQRKFQAQTRPERAMPVQEIISVEEFPDLVMRRKIQRLQNLKLGAFSPSDYQNALIRCKGSVDDAANYLIAEEISDDDLPSISNLVQEPQMKQTLNAPIKSIAERYTTSTQLLKKPSQPAVETPPKKARKRLVQGRRHASSPSSPVLQIQPPAPAMKPPKVLAKEVEDESDLESYDSGVPSDDENDSELEGRVLAFLNKCQADELADLVSVDIESAKLMVACRPFKNLDIAREVSNAKTTKSGRKSTRAPIGDKIVDNAIRMWSGYEAVDALVAECKRLGEPLAEAIGKWGFNVYGASKGQGNVLEITSLDFEDDLSKDKDSGIGTPSSKATSQYGDPDEEDAGVVSLRAKRQTKFIDKPTMMADSFVLKDFQRVGLNWLALLYKHKLSCILADEMGCGKTCQVISFLAYLTESGISAGPHLVIVPPSTLENWLREFARFCPQLVVDPYYGSQAEREEAAFRILEQRDSINVVISTYQFTEKPQDYKFMKRLRANVCVYDEGHLLKNSKSQRYQALMKIPANFRVLLTGTPLQNNLMELASLLNFILPDIFSERREELDYVFKHKATTSATSHAALLSDERISRAKSMLTPFILQRKADVVLKDLPPKTNRVEYCDLHPSQAVIYDALREKTRKRAEIRVEGGKVPNDGENNPIMQARKAALHPMLFRRHFTDGDLEKMVDLLKKHEASEFSQPRDKILMEMQLFSDFYLHLWCTMYPCIAKFDVPDLTWMNSGKVEALVRLLESYKANGDRVLVFSQFTLVLDILEKVLQTALIPFSRFDGTTKVNDRQAIMDNFRNDKSVIAFLLSTGAGGTGVNLEMANKVVIFDSSFNPHDDVQAEKRAHRLGQTRPVEVVRMVTRGTIEEQIYALGQSKLALDQKVTGVEDASLRGEQLVAKMLLQDEANKAEESAKAEEVPGTVGEGKTRTQKTSLATRKKKGGSDDTKTDKDKMDDEMLLS